MAGSSDNRGIDVNAINGQCPSCKNRGTLFLDVADNIVCSHIGCHDPGTAGRLLNIDIQPDRLRPFHTADIDGDGWVLTHPLDCKLVECRYNAIAKSWQQPPREPGTYVWIMLHDDYSQWQQVI